MNHLFIIRSQNGYIQNYDQIMTMHVTKKKQTQKIRYRQKLKQEQGQLELSCCLFDNDSGVLWVIIYTVYTLSMNRRSNSDEITILYSFVLKCRIDVILQHALIISLIECALKL